MDEGLKQKERYLFSSNEKNFGESTQLVSQIISSNMHAVKMSTSELRETQKLLLNEQSELRKKIDDFILYSTDICSEIAMLEKVSVTPFLIHYVIFLYTTSSGNLLTHSPPVRKQRHYRQ